MVSIRVFTSFLLPSRVKIHMFVLITIDRRLGQAFLFFEYKYSFFL